MKRESRKKKLSVGNVPKIKELEYNRTPVASIQKMAYAITVECCLILMYGHAVVTFA